MGSVPAVAVYLISRPSSTREWPVREIFSSAAPAVSRWLGAGGGAWPRCCAAAGRAVRRASRTNVALEGMPAMIYRRRVSRPAAPLPPPLIECRDVTVYRGDVRALDRLTLTIAAGEHVAI